ncbi:piggyBac transposable element-derived protein 5-like [Myzus persicae]|uniref:piggyBac transposable element-derived protein 5-like n=1 Tax=Myzus persicae TaxID=13164 RepID=UPI000B93756F|nr:piggyBac transposable element-derived protein 5-like [Myzus persicae]
MTRMTTTILVYLVNDEDDFIPNTDEVASITIQNNNQNLEPVWNDVDDAFQPRVLFNQTNETVGINPDIIDCLSEGTPFDFYSLFLDDEIIQLLVKETNRYAAELLKSVVSPHSRLKQWETVTPTEMKKFLGIIMWMGLCHKSSIASYWKTNNIIYISDIPKFMKRKRFELLLLL